MSIERLRNPEAVSIERTGGPPDAVFSRLGAGPGVNNVAGPNIVPSAIGSSHAAVAANTLTDAADISPCDDRAAPEWGASRDCRNEIGRMPDALRKASPRTAVDRGLFAVVGTMRVHDETVATEIAEMQA